MNRFGQKCWAWFLALILLASGIEMAASAAEAQTLSRGQQVYVPIYSHV